MPVKEKIVKMKSQQKNDPKDTQSASIMKCKPESRSNEKAVLASSTSIPPELGSSDYNTNENMTAYIKQMTRIRDIILKHDGKVSLTCYTMHRVANVVAHFIDDIWTMRSIHVGSQPVNDAVDRPEDCSTAIYDICHRMGLLVSSKVLAITTHQNLSKTLTSKSQLKTANVQSPETLDPWQQVACINADFAEIHAIIDREMSASIEENETTEQPDGKSMPALCKLKIASMNMEVFTKYDAELKEVCNSTKFPAVPAVGMDNVPGKWIQSIKHAVKNPAIYNNFLERYDIEIELTRNDWHELTLAGNTAITLLKEGLSISSDNSYVAVHDRALSFEYILKFIDVIAEDLGISDMRKRYLAQITDTVPKLVCLKVNSSPVLKIVYMLDPRKSFREFERRASAEQVQDIKRIFRSEFDRYRLIYIEKMCVDPIFHKLIGLSEMQRFAREPTALGNCKVLHWWRSKANQYPVLSMMARDFLAVKANSRPIEKMLEADYIDSSKDPRGLGVKICLAEWSKV